jgi:integrase
MPRKKRPEGTRAPNGAGSIYYSETDKRWHARIIVGVKDNGEPDRRHRSAETEKALPAKVKELQDAAREGTARKTGRAPKLSEWLTHWVENISAPTIKHTSAQAYRNAVYIHLNPGLGEHRIDKIEPDHFEKLYAKMIAAGQSPGNAHQVHRTAVTALNVAMKRRLISHNPASLAEPPRVEEEEIQPFEVEEVQRIIATALTRRNGVRFVVALALGIRQGEALGLKWERLDQKTKSLRFPKQIQRHGWNHGCDNPYKCAERWHKIAACPPDCRHKKCPKLCAPNCAKHGQYCPQRRDGGLVEVSVKSKAGKRGIALPDTLYGLLMKHKAEQDRERKHAGNLWQEGGWMFTTPTGTPIDPRRDMEQWKELLSAAGVRDARLHDARHTAATVLLLLEVPDRAVMDVMGWSEADMLQRYQHVTEKVRRNIADKVEKLLWSDH